MGAALENAVFADDHDFIRAADGGQAVGDHQRCAPLGETIKRGLNLALGGGIQRAGRLVQNEHARVFQEDTGDGDALLLAAGEHHAALADDGVVSVRHGHHVLVNFSQFGGLDHIVHRRVRAAVADIIQNRTREEEDILLDDADAAAQIGQLDMADILPVERDRAGGNLVEARDQLAERRFAAAALADQRQHFAGLDVQIDVGENVALALVIGEGDVVEADVAVHMGQRDRIGRIDDIRVFVHDGAEALEARHALRELLGELGQLANRALHAGNVHVEGDERGDIHLVFHNQIAAHEDDGQAHQVHHQLRAGEEARHHLVIALLGGNVLIRAAGELVDLLILVAERLGDAHAGNGAFDFRVDARCAALDVAGDLHHVASAHRDEQDDHRHGDHQHERQLLLDVPEDEERAGQRHDGDEQILRAVVRQLRDIEQIRRHAGHQQAGAVFVVKAEAEFLHVCEDGRAHIRFDVNAHQVPQIGDDPLRRRADEERGEHRAHHNQEGAHRLIGNVVVKHLARDHREQNIHQRDHQRAEHIQQEHAQMRLVECGKLAERAALGRGLFFKGGKGLIGACVVHHVILLNDEIVQRNGIADGAAIRWAQGLRSRGGSIYRSGNAGDTRCT